MSPSSAPRQYPIACPSCEEEKGYPCQVRTMTERRGSIEIKLRCRACEHEWVEVITTDD